MRTLALALTLAAACSGSSTDTHTEALLIRYHGQFVFRADLEDAHGAPGAGAYVYVPGFEVWRLLDETGAETGTVARDDWGLADSDWIPWLGEWAAYDQQAASQPIPDFVDPPTEAELEGRWWLDYETLSLVYVEDLELVVAQRQGFARVFGFD